MSRACTFFKLYSYFQLSHCSSCVTALCLNFIIMWSKCRYLVSCRTFTELLRILAIVTTVQHFNQYSGIKFYRHHCEGDIIGKGFYFRRLWVQKWQSLCNHVIWWMNALVDIIIADFTAGQRNWCFAEIGSHRKNPLNGNFANLSNLYFCIVQFVIDIILLLLLWNIFRW